MQINVMVRYRWAFFIASYILGHLFCVKAQLSSLLAGHDCSISSTYVLGVVKFVDFFRINFCIISVLQLLMVSRISQKNNFFWVGKGAESGLKFM